MRSLRIFACAGLALAICGAKSPAPPGKVGYQYSRHGNSSDSKMTPSPTVVLSGGGTDVDESIVAMCKGNNGGDFLVLGTETFNKNYYSYIRNTCDRAGFPANSVAMLIVPDRAAADDDFVATTLAHAEAIWIAGGDQSKYISLWRGSGLQSALNSRINQIAIGGISAGMNILTEFVYTAMGSAVTSSGALANPNDPNITLGQAFLGIDALAGTIGDPHFVARDRMGRDLTFLYRIFNEFSSVARTISIDEATALVITTAGSSNAAVVGTGKVYVLEPPAGSIPATLASGPLTGMYNIPVYRFAAGPVSWPVGGTPPYTISVVNGALHTQGNNNAIY